MGKDKEADRLLLRPRTVKAKMERRNSRRVAEAGPIDAQLSHLRPQACAD